MTANLRPFLRPKLDVLFVALNPPAQSNENGHYFSGKNSRFFHLVHLSGLITKPLAKEMADEIVFGSTVVNYRGSGFGVVDLVEHLVETDSSRVRPARMDVDSLLQRVRKFRPRFVCVIHSKARDALNGHPDIAGALHWGMCGSVLRDSQCMFVVNYFPNGNRIADEPKLKIFRALRDML